MTCKPNYPFFMRLSVVADSMTRAENGLLSHSHERQLEGLRQLRAARTQLDQIVERKISKEEEEYAKGQAEAASQ